MPFRDDPADPELVEALRGAVRLLALRARDPDAALDALRTQLPQLLQPGLWPDSEILRALEQVLAEPLEGDGAG
ncbi:hypothetical protein JYK14_20470 [Siccirubricoccus sp. KC 17139]|uniref:Uncharacterized protein n=1 Tax=Siccirubricoccus soli TaxID=2899147 RepID=A0ABT1D9G3_9PROT|nr:hypothetical protein [Siccirubricoccus soli]MCO6418519.1 hypothetical protein [Siccirubricoccus soli]MCP2684654.1 hypothetical protein [Siccirubricoccus soli]